MYYKIKDNSQAIIDAPVAATDTVILLETGEGANLPDLAVGETAKIVLGQLVTSPTVLNVFEKFEVVLMTDKNEDTITVTRAQDGTTAQSFLAGDLAGCFILASHLTQIQDAIDSKISLEDYISGSKLFASSATGSDAYAITLSDITTLTDGMRVYFEVDVANSGEATLDVSSTGAKSLKIFGGGNLQTGYISAGQIVCVAYDAGNDYWEVFNVIDQSETITAERFVQDVELGEAVTAGDKKGAVFFGEGIVDTKLVEQTTGGSDIIVGNGTSQKARELIPVPNASDFANILREKILSIKKVLAPTDNLSFSLYEDDGVTLIQEINDLPGSGFSTSYADNNLYETAVASSVGLHIYEFANENKYSGNTQGIVITPNRRCSLDSLSIALSGTQDESFTITVYNNTTSTIINQTSFSNVGKYDTLALNNVVLENGEEYYIYASASWSPYYPYYVALTSITNNDNIDITGGYKDGGVIDTLNAYLFDYVYTTELPASGATQSNLSGYEGEDVYLIIERDGAQDASNYYVIEGQTGGDTVETYDGVSWNDVSKNLVSSSQRGYNFEEDKVWLFDARYDSTRKINGVVIESGVAGENKAMVKAGGLAQTSASIGDSYYGDDSVELTGSQIIDTDNTEYSNSSNGWIEKIYWKFTDNKYVEKIIFDLRTTSSSYNVNVRIKINGIVVSTTTSYDTSYVNTTVIIDKYLMYGDIISIDLYAYTATTYMKDIILYQQNYNFLRGEFTNSLPTTTTPFLIGKGTTNTEIELMINEQNFGLGISSGNSLISSTVYFATKDGIVSGYGSSLVGYKDDTDGTTQATASSSNISMLINKGDYYKITGTLTDVRFY